MKYPTLSETMNAILAALEKREGYVPSAEDLREFERDEEEMRLIDAKIDSKHRQRTRREYRRAALRLAPSADSQ